MRAGFARAGVGVARFAVAAARATLALEGMGLPNDGDGFLHRGHVIRVTRGRDGLGRHADGRGVLAEDAFGRDICPRCRGRHAGRVCLDTGRFLQAGIGQT